MTAILVRAPIMVVPPLAAGAVAALVLAERPDGAAPLIATAFVALVAALVVWPWAALPAAIAGGAIVVELLELERVTDSVVVHGIFLGAALPAVLIRATLAGGHSGRVRTVADKPMLAFATAVALAGLFGLARGNAPYEVAVAGYQLAVVPLYFFLATFTLTTPARLRRAWLLFAVAASATAIVDFATPGRHGGLLSLLALPAALVAAGELRGGRRALLVAAAALFCLDVALSGHRALWLAGGIATLLLLWRGSGRIRLAAGLVLFVAVVVGVVAAFSASGVESRVELAGTRLDASAGYRLPEAELGLDAFLASPILGDGLGQVRHDVYLPDFSVTDVGPVYHVFYVTVLANAGLVGLVLLLWPLLRTLARRTRRHSPLSLAYRALLVGAMAGAAFSGPTDGHWELGLLPALALLARPVQLEVRR